MLEEVRFWKLFSAGNNKNRELGRGGDWKVPAEVDCIPPEGIVCVSAGSFHCGVLYLNGAVLGWGFVDGKRIGFGKGCELLQFPTLIYNLPRIIDMKCGCHFTLFLTEDKRVLIASQHNQNQFEEIFIGEPAVALFGLHDPWIVGESGRVFWVNEKDRTIQKFGPFKYGYPRYILSIEKSVILITAFGKALGMSMQKLRPDYFKKGDKVIIENTEKFKPIPSLHGKKIKKVAGYSYHFMVLTENNKVLVWGRNENGELGMGDLKNRYDGFEKIRTVGESQIVDIAAGNSHSILIDSSRRLWGFGYDNHGRTMVGKGGPLSNIIDGAVGVHCGFISTYVEIGNARYGEAGTRLIPK